MSQQHRTIAGKILYTSKKPEILDQERGRETFVYTRHSDGKLTLRAHCEIDEPAPTVMRDIVHSLDENDRPIDCFVRLTVGDAFMGAPFDDSVVARIGAGGDGDLVDAVTTLEAMHDVPEERLARDGPQHLARQAGGAHAGLDHRDDTGLHAASPL